ncbi:hypothetical protein [Flavobacterium silvaticum]|uniref:Lipocalin-like domain-containing protein n=1 Tax=Flavobacterium silvaticum TaxID=1852020 RepID=A0A972FTP9_9FLAO|nr:hypothetical protein [Flavobacterium silvaticum]NMH27817.1 hypothetical protein [Flavobacterium silvaticum]
MQKKVLAIIASVFLSAIFLVQCNSNDDNGSADPVIGTWKLVEVTQNSQQVAVSSCDLMEMYIFGGDQFSHEIYSSASGRYANVAQDDDDDEDSDDEESDDEESDDEGSDDEGSDDEGSDDGEDDGTDDGGTGGGVCVLTETQIGNWVNTGAAYTLEQNGSTQNLPIHFTDNNTRFYYEVTVGGTTTRYIFQRQ